MTVPDRRGHGSRRRHPAGRRPPHLGILAAAAGLAILLPVLPFGLEMLALRRMTPTAFGTLMALEPALGVLLGLLILHQQPSAVQVVGILLVVLAGAAAQLGGRRRQRHRSGAPVLPASTWWADPMFTGLSAFPLTRWPTMPSTRRAFIRLVERLSEANVDSITALGSTGSYAYLSSDERSRVAQLAVEHAGGTPVVVGIGALRTSQVLTNAENAERAGASALLLAPMTYQPLTGDEVFELFRTVTAHSSLPVVVYDNPGTTHFTFTTDSTHASPRCPASLPSKSPGYPLTRSRRGPGSQRNPRGRSRTRDHRGGRRRNGRRRPGRRVRCLVLGHRRHLARTGHWNHPGGAGRKVRDARAASERLAPLWELFAEFGGSIRVVAAIAERLGLAPKGCLPLPIRGLTEDQRRRVAGVIDALGLHG